MHFEDIVDFVVSRNNVRYELTNVRIICCHSGESSWILVTHEDVTIYRIMLGKALLRTLAHIECRSCQAGCYRSRKRRKGSAIGRVEMDCSCLCHTNNLCTIRELDTSYEVSNWTEFTDFFATYRPEQLQIIVILQILPTDISKLIFNYLS
jgi:hypothetical protein